MEQIGKVDVVAFDKTGTLTLGEPTLIETISLNGYKKQEILSLIASAERLSEHPLARAIVGAARTEGIELQTATAFEALPGHGVSAEVNGKLVVIGNRMLQERRITLHSEIRTQIGDLEARGNTVIPVAIDGEIAGLMVVSDSVRPESKEAIANLRELQISETVLISGDNKAVAESIGAELGVGKVLAETLPAQKLDLISEMQAKGLKVAYIGDGVNDAPALAKADVGIAMGTIGTNVAMETADIVLLTDRIERIPYLIDLSRVGLDVIRNNVIFSMSMNILRLFI